MSQRVRFGLKLKILLAPLALAVGLVTACHFEATDETDAVGVVQQAAITTFNASFNVHSEVDLNRAAVVADGAVAVSDEAQVDGDIDSITSTVTLGTFAITKSIVATGGVTVGAHSSIFGSILTQGTATVASNASVTGGVSDASDGVHLPSPNSFAWSYQAESVSAGSITVATNLGQHLAPGTYTNVIVQTGAKLTLRTGIYRFSNLVVDGQILIDSADGPVQVYLSNIFLYRGGARVASATVGQPQLLIFKTGNFPVVVAAPFTGALVAPSSTILVKASPDFISHRALFVGSTVTVDPEAVIRLYAFPWQDLVPGAVPRVPANTPVHAMPRSPADMPVGSDVNGNGPRTASSNPGRTVTFTMPTSYPVAGGVIANGTVTFKFVTPAGTTVTVIYRGGSSSASPTGETELNRGRILTFVSASDGQPATAVRQGRSFELSVSPVTGYPVTVNSPVVNDKSCSEEMQLLSPVETQTMRQNFRWSNARAVAATNTDGKPALYYAWIYIRNKADALSLKKLYIHVLGRPLFNEELDRFAGKCGTFANPGDGTGTFVPAVIPGATYNKLVEALTSNQISGDKVIFDAVILRDPPAAARNSNGSIRLDFLGQSRFQYLHYEPRPLLASADIQLDGSSVTKALVDVLTFVATVAKDTAELVTNTLALIDGALFRDFVDQTIFLHVLNPDSAFAPGSVIRRGWGPLSNEPLGAPGLQVSILQKFLDLPIPMTSMGSTDSVGRTNIRAVDGAAMRGTGLCVELKNRAAMISDFLLPNELCDLRAFNDMTGTIENFRLRNVGRENPIAMTISSGRMTGMVLADDVYRYDSDVLEHKPRRARILSGFWADTFTQHNDDGARLYASCLGFPNTVSLADVVTDGFLRSLINQLVNTAIGLAGVVMVNSDIVMPLNSSIRRSRITMSHEYGHYTLCSLMHASNTASVHHLISSTLISDDDKRVTVRYMNEAFADYIAGQVGGGANQSGLGLGRVGTEGGEYCTPNRLPCFDNNLRGTATDEDGSESIGRVVTLFHDAFDGAASKRRKVPNNADAWQGTIGSLTFSPTNYGNEDALLETVALPGPAWKQLASSLASGLGSGGVINDARVYGAVNHAMRENGVNWCNRCRVLALHSPTNTASPDTIRSAFTHCIGNSLIRGALVDAAPEAGGRIRASTCTACAANQTSNDSGVCQTCTRTIVGNECRDCSADVVLDGNTMGFGTTSLTVRTASGDTCPGVFTVELRNPNRVFALGGTGLSVSAVPVSITQAQCNRAYTLTLLVNSSAGFVNDQVLTATGVFDPGSGGFVEPSCSGLPTRSFTSAEVSSGTARRFSIPNDATRKIVVTVPTNPR